MSKSILKSGFVTIVMLAFGFSAIHANEATVNWTAFKTPAKKGVGGSFDKVTFTTTSKDAKDVTSLLTGATINIDTTSVNSKNPGRDKKLVEFFFNKLAGATITGNVLAVNAKTNTISVDLTMNGVTKTTPLHYSVNDGKVSANGVIDIFDFQGQDALVSINKSCFKLHQGKTWSDVSIEFTTSIH